MLRPQKIQYENVLLVCTDAAPYMVKCMKGLQTLYPKMLHVTCKAHALQRVAEIVRSEHPLVNKLIASGKNIFVKDPQRIEMFKNHAPEISLPPSPFITRWGTWIDAATYYSKHFQKFEEIVMKLDKSQAVCIEECQQVLQNDEVVTSLSVIASTFSILSSSIKKLETRGLPLLDSVELINNVESELCKLYDKRYYKKFVTLLNRTKTIKF